MNISEKAETTGYLFFYRFELLTPKAQRLPHEIPLGFRWVFNADPPLLKILIEHLRQWQIHNPDAPHTNRLQVLQFCSTWIDPMVLTFLSPLVALLRRCRERAVSKLTEVQAFHRDGEQFENDNGKLGCPDTKPLASRPNPWDGKVDSFQADLALTTTSHCERTNLTVRLFNRRFTRLTLGYSKKVENLRHAVALFVAHFNFCRVHSAHKQTPAQSAGLTNHHWTIEELLSNSAI